MTTSVIINSHAGWPVEVEQIWLDSEGGKIGESTYITVPANTEMTFHIHSNMSIAARELRKPEDT